MSSSWRTGVWVAWLSFGAHHVGSCNSLQSAVEACSEPVGVEIPHGVPLSVFVQDSTISSQQWWKGYHPGD